MIVLMELLDFQIRKRKQQQLIKKSRTNWKIEKSKVFRKSYVYKNSRPNLN